MMCSLLMMTCMVYAEISIDDMDSLLKENSLKEDSLLESDIGSAKENERGSKRGSDRKEEDLGLDSSIDGKVAGNSAQSSLVITVIVAVFAVIFIGVIFFLYAKTKKLVDDAQISKDLAEKYFYNVQEYKESFERIKREIDLSLAAIDKGVENIDKEIETKLQEKLNGLNKILVVKVNNILKNLQAKSMTSDQPQYVLKKGKPSVKRDDSIAISKSRGEKDNTPIAKTISEPIEKDDAPSTKAISKPLKTGKAKLPKGHDEDIQESINYVNAVINEGTELDETIKDDGNDTDQPKIFWRNDSAENTDDHGDEIVYEMEDKDEDDTETTNNDLIDEIATNDDLIDEIDALLLDDDIKKEMSDEKSSESDVPPSKKTDDNDEEIDLDFPFTK